MRYIQKTIFNMAADSHIGFAKFWYFFATWLLLDSKFTSANQISLKSRLRYCEKNIFKWRPSAILNFPNLVFWSCDLCRNMIMLLLTEFRVNRAINRWDITKKRFSIGSRPPYWICCGVIILHPGNLYYVPNIVFNFHLDWFSTFWCTWSFMFHHFGWKLPIQGKILWVLGGK